MVWLGYILIFYLFALLTAQAVLVLGYIARLWKLAPEMASDADCPVATVVLCVRGSDPSLVDAVRAILRQDYPDYELLFVFDSERDPGFKVVQDLIREPHDCAARLLVLPKASGHSSLKCDAVVHATKSLSEQTEIVALIDADTIAHPSWLREMVVPFKDPQVGATTGLRWYEAPGAEMGPLVRSIWNTAAIVQMYWYRITWGGSLAVRRQVLHETNLVKRWAHAFCEDTLVRGELENQGYRVVVIPSLHMVNYERCTIQNFYPWASRQLLTTRLYHPAWPFVLGHGMGTSCGLALGVILFLLAFWFHQVGLVAALFISLCAYEAISLALLWGIVLAARRILKRAGRPLPSWGGEMGILYAVALPVTQVMYAFAMIRAMFAKSVQWRGIRYDLRRDGSVRLRDYAPFSHELPQAQQDHSL